MKAPDKLSMDPCRFSDVGIFDVDEDEVVYIRKDAVVDKLYKWFEEDTTVADYYSKEAFAKVVDKLFR